MHTHVFVCPIAAGSGGFDRTVLQLTVRPRTRFSSRRQWKKKTISRINVVSRTANAVLTHASRVRDARPVYGGILPSCRETAEEKKINNNNTQQPRRRLL